MRKLTTEEFIKRAREVHGDKYDYSKTVYLRSSDKVKIICPEHGEFEQTAMSHLLGFGCAKCAGNKIWESRKNERMTTEKFIEKAREIHGDRYDYTKAEYKGSHTKVCIICTEHGEFWQMPFTHLKGRGCDKCGDNIISKKLAMGKEKFIERATEVHNGKYTYPDYLVYKNNCTKVPIICPEHGEFWQIPNNHLKGQGCPKCSEYRNEKYTVEEFAEKAREIHGDYYDYSKVEYVNNHTLVKIICPEHGEFEQIPDVHLQGCGCNKCHRNRMEREWILYLEKNHIEYKHEYGNGFGRLRLDFYLPEYNAAIECQGIQHFQPTCFGGDPMVTVDNFKSCVERDIKKKKLCESKGVRLFYFTNLKYVIKTLNLADEYGGIYKDCIYTRKNMLLSEIKKFDLT